MKLLLEQPVRMLAETRALAALAASSDWLTGLEWGFTSSGEMRVNFDITLLGKVHEAVMVYPDLFPHAAPYVRPREVSETWSSHQYGSGTLCLEWGPDNWNPGVTGADLVTSTQKLLVFEKLGPVVGFEAPSRHELTPGQKARGQVCRFVTTSKLVEAVRTFTEKAPVPLVTQTTYRFAEMIAFATRLGDDDASTIQDVPSELSEKGDLGTWKREGWLVFCDEWQSLPRSVTSQSSLREFLKGKGCWPWPDDEDQKGFLLIADSERNLRPFGLSKGDGRTAYEYFVVDGTETVHQRQPEVNLTLQSKKVAIVGLGSVGSKVAVSLARSGVTHFLLVDDDVMKPANLVRSQLDWLSIGYDKVAAVKGAIQLVQAAAEVQCKVFRLSGQESAYLNTAVLEQIAACDLVIDATASAKVFSSLAAICTRRKVPLVWGELFAGGIGALMARSVPGLDADPLEVRAAIHRYLAEKPEAPFQSAQGYDIEVEDRVLVGGDAEVSQLSASIVQFSLDALAGGQVGGGYRFPVAAYLMGYQLAWIFEAPFDVHPVEAPPAPTGPPPSEDAEENASAFGELVAVFGEKKC